MKIKFSTAFLMLLLGFVTLKSEEGMWTFENPPVKQVQSAYNFEITQSWLEHVRLSSVRFMLGGSGSFVSPDGLVMTNHHVAVGLADRISTPKNDYARNGYAADDFDEELKLPGGECNVLIEMTNITDRIRNSANDAKTSEDKSKAVNKETEKVKKEFKTNDSIRYDVVSFYNGGEYWLFKYKKYTDIRLVFIPEAQMAHYGGEEDNFVFPRWCLDVTFVRIYENNKPLKTPNYFKWKTKGAEENELVFVTGHPGTTERQKTYAQMENFRDFTQPASIKWYEATIDALKEYSKKGEKEAREALMQINGLSNGYKATKGRYAGLLDPVVMNAKKAEDDKLRAAVNDNPVLKSKYAQAWIDIQNLLADASKIEKKAYWYHQFLNAIPMNATQIIRYCYEVMKPDSLRENPNFNAEKSKKSLSAGRSSKDDMDRLIFEKRLSLMVNELGKDDQLVTIALAGRSIKDAVKNYFDNSKLNDTTYLKILVEKKPEEILADKDPILSLAMQIWKLDSIYKKPYREDYNRGMQQANEKIADARFAVYAREIYPDANFTLRLTYGKVKGYPYNGTLCPSKTTLYGLYDRAESFNNKDEFALTTKFWDKKEDVNLSTPVNFVSTCDIIGGNSGSPVINKNAEIVGLVFDGNMESLPGRYFYDITKNRTVAVHPAYIIEALRNVYKAKRVAKELEK